MLPALMSDLCYSVRPSVRLSRNSCSRQKPTSCHETQPQISLCHETQEGPSTCHETQSRGAENLSRNSRGEVQSRNSRRVEHLSRNSRGAEHLSRNSRGVEDRSRNSRGGQRSQVSVQGLRPHRIHPLCVHARCFCSVQKKSIPSIRALAFSFFSDINRHHFSSVSELEAEGEPCR